MVGTWEPRRGKRSVGEDLLTGKNGMKEIKRSSEKEKYRMKSSREMF